jgi:predicted O-methyltransferase YrrM
MPDRERVHHHAVGRMIGFADDPGHAEDLHAWHILRPLLDAGGYLPWGTGAMRPAGLVMVCNEIMYANRTTIVECGSGVSTVVLARLLRSRSRGTLIALEHDAGWAARVSELLAAEALDHVAQVVHAPLSGDPRWYDRAALRELPADIDLLIVDGPPAYVAGDELRRAPALELLDPRLAPGATVVLDDVDRAGERDVLAGWESATPWRFTIEERAGIAIGARG